jgi:hypothetical protein
MCHKRAKVFDRPHATEMHSARPGFLNSVLWRIGLPLSQRPPSLHSPSNSIKTPEEWLPVPIGTLQVARREPIAILNILLQYLVALATMEI